MIIVIIGAQWGDEGKGKVVDLLADRFDIVARYQGGHNAGHSVYVGDKAFVLRLLPSGMTPRPCVVRMRWHRLVLRLRQYSHSRHSGV